jgi:threonine/homoserine/homoserine lactone efflux protein
MAVVDRGENAGARRGKSFGLGLATQLSNPKTAVVYASIFAALLPAHLPGWMWLALPPLIFAVEAGWYTAVALLFSSPRPRAAYLLSKRWIDRLAGSVMGALGVRLILDMGRPA